AFPESLPDVGDEDEDPRRRCQPEPQPGRCLNQGPVSAALSKSRFPGFAGVTHGGPPRAGHTPGILAVYLGSEMASPIANRWRPAASGTFSQKCGESPIPWGANPVIT